MNRVFVLDMYKKPLMPCHPARARQLLKKGRAAIFRYYPFTIILKDWNGGDKQDVRIKIDPGSKQSGMALVGDFKRGKRVIWAAIIQHRGDQIRRALQKRRAVRRNRRSRKTRYRKPRFLNRRRPEGWLPPSIESRIANITTWVRRLSKWCPISHISLELVKFDTQKLENPEIKGTEYQKGELFGYEVKEYLLEKWGRKCAYCGATNIPLEIDHIIPKSRGGTDRVSNLTLACRECNLKKGKKTAAEFGHPEIQAKAEKPLRDAAVVNAIRWKLLERLKEFDLPIECGSGGRTKYNRVKQGYRKEHWIDAACIGESGGEVYIPPNMNPLTIKATGWGNRQMCKVDKYGFPRSKPKQKIAFGFQTGDIVKAVIPKGKNKGKYIGRVIVRADGYFNIQTSRIVKQKINHRYCQIVQKSDGYSYY